jgi:hypothetical protein
MAFEPTENGYIFLLFDNLMSFGQKISLVEYLKKFLVKTFAKNDITSRRNWASFGIDIFVKLKWIFLLLVFFMSWNSWPFVIGIAYLMLMNLHTYFWYHLWVSDQNISNPSRERRRFVNLMLSVGFMILGFAYFFSGPFMDQFSWPKGQNTKLAALIFSIGNSLTGFAGDTTPITPAASVMCTTQLCTTFIFLTMLLGNSTPKPRE